MMFSGRMDLGFPTIGLCATKHFIEAAVPALGALNSHRLPHDGAAASQDLEIRHGSPTWRNIARACRERTKSGGRRLVEKWAH